MKPQKRNTEPIRQCCSCRLWKQESEFEPFKDTVTSASYKANQTPRLWPGEESVSRG